MEKEEAKRVLDELAREIHGIYGQHATEAGLKTPKWEELPESAKRISRDISRLVLAKMQEAYNEGKKVSLEAGASPPPPVQRPPASEEVLKAISDLKSEIEKIGVIRQVAASPIVRGLNEAVSKLTEKLALEIISENPELLSKLRQVAEAELVRFLSYDEKEEV